MVKKTLVVGLLVLSIVLVTGCMEDPTPTVSPIAAPAVESAVVEDGLPVNLDLPPFFDDVATFFRWLVAIPEVKVIGGHVLFNTMVAVAVALYTGDFQFKRLWEFFYRKLAPYVLVYGAARLFGDATGTAGLATTLFAMIEAMLVADLADNLGKIGIKWPEGVARAIK